MVQQVQSRPRGTASLYLSRSGDRNPYGHLCRRLAVRVAARMRRSRSMQDAPCLACRAHHSVCTAHPAAGIKNRSIARDSWTSSQPHMRKDIGRALRLGLALWCIQVLVLAIGASLLAYGDGRWVDHLERLRVVRNLMANPLEMIAVKAFGTLCMLVGILGAMDNRDSLFDSVWEGPMPLFIGVCLTLLFVRGLLHPWWLFR
jgi:hypothetical protein